MSTADPAALTQTLAQLESGMRVLAGMDPAGLPPAVLSQALRALERHDAAEAAVRGKLLAAHDAQGGPAGDGQRTTKAWLVHTSGVTRRQAAEHLAVQRIAEDHPALHAALAEGAVITKSVALDVAKWTAKIPGEYRGQAEDILVAAARAGADLRALAVICAEIRARLAPPDRDGPDPDLDRGVSLHTTMDGAGVLRGDLSPHCSAMVQAVLDALSVPEPGGDCRTLRQRYHDGLAEAMRRLLSSDLLPKRAGQPVKGLVHIYFAELRDRDGDGALQDKWIAVYRARWAGQRAGAAVSTGDGGAWLEGDAARAAAAEAILIPVVTGDIDVTAIEDLITACVEYHRIREHAAGQDHGPDAQDSGTAAQPGHTAAQPGHTAAQPGHTGAQPGHTGAQPGHITAQPGDTADQPGDTAAQPDGPDTRGGALAQAGPHDGTAAAGPPGSTAQMLAMLEHQILAAVIQVVSGPGGVASFLRRAMLGKGLNGPSLPLDVGQTDDIPVHLRRLVALRDQTCQHPGGCDRPAAQCEPHHVVHRADGGPTSLTNLKDYCWWHHHVLIHELGWKLTVHPDGTSQITSPDGNTIHSHSPPPRPG